MLYKEYLRKMLTGYSLTVNDIQKLMDIIIYIDMKALNFQVIAAAQNANSLFEYSNFCESGPCDMCWGDLSL